MKKFLVLLAIVCLTLPALAFADGEGEAIYKKSCAFCHDSGVAGAPKVGDKAAWKERIDKGVDDLTETAIKGKGAMPPKGGNASLTDKQIEEAVEYMVEKSK